MKSTPTARCVTALTMALTLYPAAVHGEGVTISTPQPAVFRLKTGAVLQGQLLSLNSSVVECINRNRKFMEPATNFVSVQTQDDLYIYNNAKGMFESAREQEATRRQEEATRLQQEAEMHKKLTAEGKAGRFLVRIGEWQVGPQSTYTQEDRRNQERLVAEREGIFGLGEKTGNFHVEGGETYKVDVEHRERYVFAHAQVENPTDNPIEVTVTLKFHFKQEFVLGVDFTDKQVTNTEVIAPRCVVTLTVGADSGAKLTGAVGEFSKAMAALGGGDPNVPYSQAVSHVTVSGLTSRVK